MSNARMALQEVIEQDGERADPAARALLRKMTEEAIEAEWQSIRALDIKRTMMLEADAHAADAIRALLDHDSPERASFLRYVREYFIASRECWHPVRRATHPLIGWAIVDAIERHLERGAARQARTER